jgi:transcriptional regulator with XRE-family HTH domain
MLLTPHNPVKQLRDELNLTQKELAAKLKEHDPTCNASQSSVHMWELAGLRANIDSAISICSTFDLTLAEYYGLPEEKALLRDLRANDNVRDKVAFLRYRNLTPKQRNVIDDLLLEFSKANSMTHCVKP